MDQERILLEYVLNGDVSGVFDLLESGADPNVLLPEGAAPLHIAAGADVHQEAIVCLLFQYGADPNILSSEGVTPLHVSATYDKCRIVKLLLLNGADPDIRDEEGLTAVDCARGAGCDVCVFNISQTQEENTVDTSLPWNSSQEGKLKHSSETWLAVDALKDQEDEPNSSLSFHTCSDVDDSTLLGSTTRALPGKGYLTGKASEDQDRTIRDDKSDASPGLPPNYHKNTERRDKYIDYLSKGEFPVDIEVDSHVQSKCQNMDDQNSLHEAKFNDEKSYSIYKWTQSIHQWNEGLDLTPNPDDPHLSLNSLSTQDFVPTDFDNADLSINSNQNGNHSVASGTNKSLHPDCENNIKKPDVRHDSKDSHSPYQNWFSKLRRFWPYSDKSTTPSLSNQNKNMTAGQSDISTQENPEAYLHESEPCFYESVLDYSSGKKEFIPRTSSRQLDTQGVASDLESLALSSISLTSTIHNRYPSPPVGNLPRLDELQMAAQPFTKRRLSSASSTGTIQYLYTDEEDGFSLIETWFPVTDPITTSPLALSSASPKTSVPGKITDEVAQHNQKPLESAVATIARGMANMNMNVEASSISMNEKRKGSDGSFIRKHHASSSEEPENLRDSQLRERLKIAGGNPGPITSTTRKMYERRLGKLSRDPISPRCAKKDRGQIGHNSELKRLLSGDLDTTDLQRFEDQMCEAFAEPDPTCNWREGTKKSSFNYLLLDPRITCNLPARVKSTGEVEGFNLFVQSVFYVGKGKRARPYAHFKEAIQHKSRTDDKQPSAKVGRILDIWSEAHGVISLHVYQNVIPVEAYTREAAMIDAIGRHNLTNVKAGEYYGVASQWNKIARRQLGVRLLHKAFRIFLSEGERHIRPCDLHDK